MPFKKDNKYKFEKGSIPWNKGKELKDYPQMGFQKEHESFSEKGRFEEGHIPKHSKINKKKLIELYSCKKTIKEIASYFECAETTVYQALEKNKIKLRDYPSGEKNHKWKGGKSFEDYGKEFNQKLKNKIKKRDNNECIFCKIELEQEKEKLKEDIPWIRATILLKFESKLNKNLSIHHIDYNKKNNSEENLITLCGSHHSKTNHHREMWIKIFEKMKLGKEILEVTA